MDGQREPPNDQYIMNIVIEPSNQARPGHVLSPPLVIRLEHGSHATNGGRVSDDHTVLWVAVALVAGDSTTPIVPLPLSGNPVDSVHPLTPGASGREVGYVSFTDLAIRAPGRYRLHASLMRMNALGGPSGPPFAGGVNSQQISTAVIDVDANAEFTTIGREQQEILDSLHQRGLRVV